MRIVHIFQRQSFLLLASLIIALTFILASCGTNTGSGSTGSAPTPTPTSGQSTGIGCPSTAVVSTPPSTPDVVVTLTDSRSTVTAHIDNTIQVNLPFGQKWTGPTTSQGVLQLQTPAGYAWQASKVCVWQFKAQAAGKTSLNFTAQPICKSGEFCPQYIREVSFTIAVQ